MVSARMAACSLPSDHTSAVLHKEALTRERLLTLCKVRALSLPANGSWQHLLGTVGSAHPCSTHRAWGSTTGATLQGARGQSTMECHAAQQSMTHAEGAPDRKWGIEQHPLAGSTAWMPCRPVSHSNTCRLHSKHALATSH